VLRLDDDIKVLCLLIEAECPSLRRIRDHREASILYCFGDASGGSFGWSIEFEKGIRCEFGEWSETIQEESSNYRELVNLANALIRVGQEGLLDGCEVFLYTDNQTAAGSYFRGSAKSRALFELIITLYGLQMQHDFILHVLLIVGHDAEGGRETHNVWLLLF
jgi:hypothetical protein